jgi:hypothetical protein
VTRFASAVILGTDGVVAFGIGIGWFPLGGLGAIGCITFGIAPRPRSCTSSCAAGGSSAKTYRFSIPANSAATAMKLFVTR